MLVPQSPSRMAALRSQPITRGRLVESSIGTRVLSKMKEFKAGLIIPRKYRKINCLEIQRHLDILLRRIHANTLSEEPAVQSRRRLCRPRGHQHSRFHLDDLQFWPPDDGREYHPDGQLSKRYGGGEHGPG